MLKYTYARLWHQNVSISVIQSRGTFSLSVHRKDALAPMKRSAWKEVWQSSWMHCTLGKQKFLHRMGAQDVTSQKALDNSWVQDGSPGECRMGVWDACRMVPYSNCCKNHISVSPVYYDPISAYVSNICRWMTCFVASIIVSLERITPTFNGYCSSTVPYVSGEGYSVWKIRGKNSWGHSGKGIPGRGGSPGEGRRAWGALQKLNEEGSSALDINSRRLGVPPVINLPHLWCWKGSPHPALTWRTILHPAIVWGFLWCHFLSPHPVQEFLVTQGDCIFKVLYNSHFVCVRVMGKLVNVLVFIKYG